MAPCQADPMIYCTWSRLRHLGGTCSQIEGLERTAPQPFYRLSAVSQVVNSSRHRASYNVYCNRLVSGSRLRHLGGTYSQIEGLERTAPQPFHRLSAVSQVVNSSRHRASYNVYCNRLVSGSRLRHLGGTYSQIESLERTAPQPFHRLSAVSQVVNSSRHRASYNVYCNRLVSGSRLRHLGGTYSQIEGLERTAPQPFHRLSAVRQVVNSSRHRASYNVYCNRLVSGSRLRHLGGTYSQIESLERTAPQPFHRLSAVRQVVNSSRHRASYIVYCNRLVSGSRLRHLGGTYSQIESLERTAPQPFHRLSAVRQVVNSSRHRASYNVYCNRLVSGSRLRHLGGTYSQIEANVPHRSHSIDCRQCPK
ncbi:hypothetical protein J6590_036069 [Homalodisca vitripennis]|nr:hypothetical protein J6590_036069 [Homalodisca vitripennis]